VTWPNVYGLEADWGGGTKVGVITDLFTLGQLQEQGENVMLFGFFFDPTEN